MNLVELSNAFPTDLHATKHFEGVRWPGGITCPYCGSPEHGNRLLDNRWHCKSCKKSFSVTTNTHLHDTRMPLKAWLFAFAVVSNAKKGVSALQLKRDIGVHYESAWRMYHTIRDLMGIENDGITLNDIVELDTTQVDRDMRKCQIEKKGYGSYSGQPDLDKAKEDFEGKGFEFKEGEYKKPCKVGRQKRGKGASDMVIAGAVQRDGDVVAEVVKNTKYVELKKLVQKYVDIDRGKTVLLTDEDNGMSPFHRVMDQIVINHKKLYSYRGLNTNSIESFWAIIKRQITGQHHHVSPEYLPLYVDEAVFKYNNRKVDDMFDTLVKFSMYPKKN
jgi:transposase-like protein